MNSLFLTGRAGHMGRDGPRGIQSQNYVGPLKLKPALRNQMASHDADDIEHHNLLQ